MFFFLLLVPWLHDLSFIHGDTMFVPVGQWNRKEGPYGDGEKDFTRTSETFSYVGGGQWRRHGEWDLPFCGHS
jgi:hypothetical protein